MSRASLACCGLAFLLVLTAALPWTADAADYDPLCTLAAKNVASRKAEVRSAQRVLKRARTKAGKAKSRKRLAKATMKYRTATKRLVACREKNTVKPGPPTPPAETPILEVLPAAPLTSSTLTVFLTPREALASGREFSVTIAFADAPAGSACGALAGADIPGDLKPWKLTFSPRSAYNRAGTLAYAWCLGTGYARVWDKQADAVLGDDPSRRLVAEAPVITR
jgi:hypothetical protein